MSCRLEDTGIFVNAEYNDSVAALVGDETEFAGRIDVEVPWGINVSSFMFYESECSFRWVDSVNGETIMSPVGAVEKPARGRDLHLCAGACALKVLRQC